MKLYKLILGLFLVSPAFSADTIGLYSLENHHFKLGSNQFQFGNNVLAWTTLYAISGNFDGAAGDTVGFYDLTEHRFYLKFNTNPGGAADLDFVFGTGAAIPLAGSWTGNGTASIGVYDLATATFYLRNSNTAGAADITFQFGDTLAYPLAGDWTNTNVDRVGTYNGTNGIFKLRYANSAGAADATFQFGPINSATMRPVVGDWDGDGQDTIGILDRANNILYVRNSNSAGPADATLQLERTNWTWQPIAGTWRAATAPAESSGYAWPDASPASQDASAERLEAAFVRGSQINALRGLLIIKNGFNIGERYYHGSNAAIGNNIKSVSKSMVSALVGIALNDGVLGNTSTPIATLLPAGYFPPGSDARLQQVTLAHLLTMTSGLDLNEDVLDPMIGSADWVGYVLSQPFVSTPGTVFDYFTGLTHVIARILVERTGMSLDQYAQSRLFTPLGIAPLSWSRDTQGYKVGGAEVWMKPRDMARFGYLYLNRGRINGVQIVPEAWVDESTARMLQADSTRAYGYQWWRPIGAGSINTPTNMYYALGYGGQYVFVVPSINLVVVTTARSDTSGAELDQAYAEIADLIGRFVLPAAASGSATEIDPFELIKVFPNPWRADRHTGHPVTFNGFLAETEVKIFTVSGRHVKTLPKSSTSATWDLTTDSGGSVASGMYLYLMTSGGHKKTGQITVIK